MSLKSNASLCLGVIGTNSMGNPNVALGLCSETKSNVQWVVATETATDALGRKDTYQPSNPAFAKKCLDIQRSDYELELFGCSQSNTQSFTFDASRILAASGPRAGLAVAVC